MNRSEITVLRWAALFVVAACVQTYRVIKLRQQGRSWTEAFTNTNRLATGNVWRDALLLLLFALLAIAAAFLLMWRW